MKNYSVMKNGEELEVLSTLTAAKKLAKAEGAEVYLDGKRVYPIEEKPDTPDELLEGIEAVKSAVKVETVTPENYRLKHLMNFSCNTKGGLTYESQMFWH